MLALILIFLVLAILFGGYGATRSPGWGYYGWSPLMLVLLVLLILWLTGHLGRL